MIQNMFLRTIRFIKNYSHSILAVVGAVTVMAIFAYLSWLALLAIMAQNWFTFDIVLSLVVAISAISLATILSEKNKIIRTQTVILRDISVHLSTISSNSVAAHTVDILPKKLVKNNSTKKV